MKKIVLMAAFAVSGLGVVSCDTEAIESGASPMEASTIQKEYYDLMAKTGDSIPVIDSTMTNSADNPPPPGPGDDVPPIKPPKP